jgi:hypothetical protein
MVKRKSVKKSKIKTKKVSQDKLEPVFINEKSHIYVQTQVEGIHYWKNAPKDKILNIKFLKNPHRHMFHIKVTLQVFDDDREFEFLLMKRWLTLVGTTIFGEPFKLKPVAMSCEMIAREILKKVYHFLVESDSSPRCVSCEVSEDGENGALVSGRFLG